MTSKRNHIRVKKNTFQTECVKKKELLAAAKIGMTDLKSCLMSINNLCKKCFLSILADLKRNLSADSGNKV